MSEQETYEKHGKYLCVNTVLLVLGYTARLRTNDG